MSIDPMTFMDSGNPAMFNRYAYSFNDPINMMDPNGESPIIHTFVRINAQAAARDPGSYAVGVARGVPRALTNTADLAAQNSIAGGNNLFKGLASAGYSATGAYNNAIGPAANSSMAIGEFTGEVLGDAVGGTKGLGTARTAAGLAKAATARDALSASLAPLKGKAPATVTGGYNTASGQVAARACGGGNCAETNVVGALGGDASKVKFTTAVRPRTGNEVPICPSCESSYGRSAFPKEARFKTDE